MSATFAFEIDGRPVEVSADPKDAVLDVLREALGVYVCKGGCAPQGLCGCCTVLVDGKPRLTCTLPVKSLAGKSVTTLMGVNSADRELVAESFAECGAAQCGYCTPGIVLSTCAVIVEKPEPSDDELHRALAPHTCRCTGYTAILEAMREAARRRREGHPAQGTEFAPEAVALALGERPFVEDLVRPGTWHGAVVFAAVPEGEVTRLETGGLPEGVVCVVLRPVGARVEHAADPVALVAARTLGEARAAAALVVVDVVAGSPLPAAELARGRRRDGDVVAALATCPHRAEVDLRLAPTDAVPLEPEAALAVPAGPEIVVYSQGHDASAVRAALVTALAGAFPGTAPSPRVVLVPSGGSYGAKAVPAVEVWATLLAVAAGAPVRLALDHLDATRARPRRPGARVRGVAGVTAAGAWTALRLEVTLDGGAVAHQADHVVARALAALAYDVPNVDVVVVVEGTGGAPTGPLRGAGAYPVCVATEALVEQVCVASGRDPLAFRRAHALPGAEEVLDALARVPAGPGVSGLALTRLESAGGVAVTVTVDESGRAELACSVPELGQGRDAVLVAEVATASGLPAAALWVPWPSWPGGWPPGAVDGAVGEAARRAGAQVRAASGAPGEYRGVDEAPGVAFLAHRVDLDADGSVWAVHAVASGGDAPGRLARGLLEGTTAMGVGLALSEGPPDVGGLPEARFRYLGTLKSKATPRIHARVLDGRAVDLGDGVGGAAAAMHVAVSRHEGTIRTALPMKDSAAARSVGVRPPRA